MCFCGGLFVKKGAPLGKLVEELLSLKKGKMSVFDL